MSRREFNRGVIVAEKLRDVTDEAQNEFKEMSLAEMIGILDTLKMELFIEQRQ